MGLPSRERKRIIVVRKRDAKETWRESGIQNERKVKAKWWNID